MPWYTRMDVYYAQHVGGQNVFSLLDKQQQITFLKKTKEMVYNYSMSNTILCNLSDVLDIIEEERLYWANDVLDALGVPEEVYDSKSIDEYRENMSALGIDVELGTSGDVKIYKLEWSEIHHGWLPRTEDHLVAHWKDPKRVKRISGKEVYYELHLDEWSILNMRESK